MRQTKSKFRREPKPTKEAEKCGKKIGKIDAKLGVKEQATEPKGESRIETGNSR
jgi:hypothetical protein